MAITTQRLIAAREQLGLNVPQLALKLGVQAGEIYNVENGNRNAGPVLLARYVKAEAITRDEFTSHMLGEDAA